MRRPTVQRRIFALAQTTPTDLVRSKLSTSEIQSRAVSSLPDELLANIPEDTSTYSLFQGFQASLPESDNDHRKSHRRRGSKGQKLLTDEDKDRALPSSISALKEERERLNHRLEMMGIRKNMCSAEIREIDNKIANLNNMRKIVLDRLAGLEMDEAELEHQCEFTGLFPRKGQGLTSAKQWLSSITSWRIWKRRRKRQLRLRQLPSRVPQTTSLKMQHWMHPSCLNQSIRSSRQGVENTNRYVRQPGVLLTGEKKFVLLTAPARETIHADFT